MTDSSTQPPPNNAGTGGGGVGWTGDSKTAIPKKKTIEYDILACTYDYGTHVFTVEGPDGSMDFGTDELAEMRAALLSFGIGITTGDGVNYR